MIKRRTLAVFAFVFALVLSMAFVGCSSEDSESTESETPGLEEPSDTDSSAEEPVANEHRTAHSESSASESSEPSKPSESSASESSDSSDSSSASDSSSESSASDEAEQDEQK